MDISHLKVSKKKLLSILVRVITSTKFTRKLAVKQLDKVLYKSLVKRDHPYFNKQGLLDRYHGVSAMLESALRNVDKGHVSKKSIDKLINVFVGSVLIDSEARTEAIKNYQEKYGIKPPLFVTISPTKKCNLNCIGCYASSAATQQETLPWSVLDKAMHELHDEMGMRFFVISGGEPLLYQSEGKNILDLPKKWADSYFLMYTNGTLISETVAQEMAELGNITPAISVEGFEENTDQRRGKGIFARILQATENLKKAGAVFGMSATATSKNIDLLMTDKFYEYFFEEVGASYMWNFQYMPIGREFTTDLMITPQQRFELYKEWRHVITDKCYFIADFWNSAILSDGCISCAKARNGYFYIDWNGKIMPCVFIPYYKRTLQELYKEGKKIQDALFDDLFVEGRKWQEDYHLKNGKLGNLLMPCFIRDHHREFVEVLKKTGALPEDEPAREALESENYHQDLYKFDDELESITGPYWDEEYVKKE